MPIVGIVELLGDAPRDRRGDGLEDDREAAGRFERARVGEQRERLLRGTALRLEAAERGRRLRGEADVAHDRDPGADDRADARQHRAGAFELHGVGARLLDEADRVPHGVLVGDLERAERHVGDDERPPRAARHGRGQHEHLVHRRGHGRVVAEDGHRGRVADEHEVGARLVGEPSAGCVVRRHHDDRLAPRLHLCELGDGELAGSGGGRGGLLRSDAHGASPSRTTLSMRRVEPTRTAPARTGGSKSATST